MQPDPEPLDASRLAHRRRLVERELRQLRKTLKRIGCSSCIQQAPSRGAIQMERRVRRLEEEMRTIDAHLAASKP